MHPSSVQYQTPIWIYRGESSKGCQGQLKNRRILLTRIILTPETIKAGEEKALGKILSICKNSQNNKMRGEGGIKKAESENCTQSAEKTPF